MFQWFKFEITDKYQNPKQKGQNIIGTKFLEKKHNHQVNKLLSHLFLSLLIEILTLRKFKKTKNIFTGLILDIHTGKTK